MDLLIELTVENLTRAFAALANLGFRPRQPVSATGSAHPEKRQRWIEELSPGLPVRFLRREALIRLKREAGRPQDLADIDQLTLLAEDAE